MPFVSAFSEQGHQLRHHVNNAAAATSFSCLPLLASFACWLPGIPPYPALLLMLGWRGERKGEPTVGLCSAELPAPVLSSLLSSTSKSSAGAFSKMFTVVPGMGRSSRELRSVSGLRYKVRVGVCQNPVTANIFCCSFFAASEKQGGIRPRSLWYALRVLVSLMAVLRIC